jgi:hypothetical protein
MPTIGIEPMTLSCRRMYTSDTLYHLAKRAVVRVCHSKSRHWLAGPCSIRSSQFAPHSAVDQSSGPADERYELSRRIQHG